MTTHEDPLEREAGAAREALRPLADLDVDERAARLAQLSLQARPGSRRWILGVAVAAALLVSLALTLLRRGAEEPTATPSSFTITNRGDLVILAHGDQVVSLVGDLR